MIFLGQQFFQHVAYELQPRRLIPSLTASLLCGISGLSVCISFALLIFSGELSEFISQGIGLMLFTGVVLNAVIALRGFAPGIFAGPGDGAVVILAIVGAAIARNMPSAATPVEILSTVVAAIALTTLLTGLLFLIIGYLKQGRLVRFIPYPVIGGFVAGTGWLMLKGSIEVMSGASLSYSTLPGFFQTDQLILWAPGVLFGTILFLSSRRYSHYLIRPSLILGAIITFYTLLWVSGKSLQEATAQGWLMKSMHPGSLWWPLTPSILSGVNFSVIFDQAGNLTTVLLVSLVQFLLYVSGIELAFERDLDLDWELRITGFANIATGLGSGMPGFHWPGLSTLARKIGVSGRIFGLFSAAFFLSAFLVGTSILSYFPKAVLGGLLAFIAFSFLAEWLYDGWSKLSRADYFIVVLILAVIGTVGFLQGVGVGILTAVIVFVVNYSRLPVVGNALSGATYQSNIERPMSHRRILLQKGEQIYILKLNGFIFFGTANSLLNHIKDRVNDPALAHLRYVVLDFRHVSGLDSSALLTIARMKQLAERIGFDLIFAELAPQMELQLEREGLVEEKLANLHMFRDLDHGLEWCENQILLGHSIALSEEKQPIREQLASSFSDLALVERLMAYLEKKEINEGYYLMHQGAPTEDLYFIESGSVTAILELDDGKTVRLRKMGAGIVVGEVGIYTGDKRSASVVSNEPGTVYRLSARALRLMQEKDPELATEFHGFVVRSLAERLAASNRSVQALLE